MIGQMPLSDIQSLLYMIQVIENEHIQGKRGEGGRACTISPFALNDKVEYENLPLNFPRNKTICDVTDTGTTIIIYSGTKEAQ
jgi:hypothetical protein